MAVQQRRPQQRQNPSQRQGRQGSQQRSTGANFVLSGNKFARMFYQSQFSHEQRKTLLLNIQRRLKRGLTGAQIAEGLIQMFTDPDLKMIARDMLNASRAGLGLMASLEGWFDQSLMTSLRTAETHGKLADEIENVVKELEEAGNAMGDVIKAFGYGVLILTVIVGVFITIVHDQLAPIIESVAKSPTEELLRMVAVAEFCDNYWHLFIIIPSVIGVIYYVALINMVGKARDAVDSSPVFDIYRRMQGGRMLNGMALMANAGLTWRQAATTLLDTSTRYTHYALTRFLRKLDQGGSVPDALEATNVFERVVIYELKGAGDDAELPDVARDIAQEVSARGIQDLEKAANQVRVLSMLTAMFGLLVLVTGLVGVSSSI